ncbi:unnamed protein product [Calicophoron daubneyi]|uniref:Protein disulfide-isomerase n=1 Tax=Calicophoron daubneyi TaxID=300641 RepID=A0AAV2TUZ4_CALDB
MWFPALLLSLPLLVSGATFTEENDVAVLNKGNFEEYFKEREYALLMFYAPWCGHCNALKPEYEKAAAQLKKDLSDVVLAKVDATVEKDLAQSHSVTGYPTLKFYKKGKWVDFNGKREAEFIISWFKRKMEPSLRTLPSLAELKSFIESDKVVVVGFIKDEKAEARKVLEETAEILDKFPFAVVSAPDAFKEYNVNSDVQISLFKKFDEGRDDFSGELKQTSLVEFVQQESIPLIVEFNQDSAGDVFGSPIRKHLVAFLPKSDKFEERKKGMEPVAKKFKGKVHFIFIDTEFEDHQRILDFFGMSKSDVPGYRLVNLADEMTKFQPDSSDFSEDAVSKFIDEVLSGTRKPFLMSQEIPPESSDPLRIIVGKNYNEVVKDMTKTVAVMLHAPWCGHCKQLSPTWDELAKAYKGRDDVVIAKMDATANEAEGLQVHSFPTIKLYPRDSDEVIDYSGDRTLEALKKFVDTNGKASGKKEEGEESVEEKRDEL